MRKSHRDIRPLLAFVAACSLAACDDSSSSGTVASPAINCDPAAKTSESCVCNITTGDWENCGSQIDCDINAKTSESCKCNKTTGQWYDCGTEIDCDINAKTSENCKCNKTTGQWYDCGTEIDCDINEKTSENCKCNKSTGQWYDCDAEIDCDINAKTSENCKCDKSNGQWYDCDVTEDKCKDVICDLVGQRCVEGACKYIETPVLYLEADNASVQEGATAALTVSLSDEPAEDVAITLSLQGADEGCVGFMVNGSALADNRTTIPKSQWQTGLRVSLVTQSNQVVDDGKPVKVIATTDNSNAQEEFRGLSKDISIFIENTDKAKVEITGPDDLYTNEDQDKNVVFGVSLSSKPQAEVSVGVRLDPDSYAQIQNGVDYLHFNADNWNTVQEVTIVGKDDGNIPNPTPNTYRLVFEKPTSADAYYSALDAVEYTLTNLDNDAPSVTFASTSVDEGEEADVQMFLSNAPTVQTTFAVSVVTTDICELKSAASVTVQPSDWSDKTTAVAEIKVKAKDDAIYREDAKCTVKVVGSSSDTSPSTTYNNPNGVTFDVPVKDNDKTGVEYFIVNSDESNICSESSPLISFNEDTMQYSITSFIIKYPCFSMNTTKSNTRKIAFTTKSQPTNAVTLNFSVTGDYAKHMKLSQNSITITPANYKDTSCAASATNCLTVTNAFDYSELVGFNASNTPKVSYTYSSTDKFYNNSVAALINSDELTFRDRSVAELFVEVFPTEITEGQTKSISFKGGMNPGATKNCTVSKVNGTDLTVNANKLTITPDNWNQSHSFDVTAPSDSVVTADRTEKLRISCDGYEVFEHEIIIKDKEKPEITLTCSPTKIFVSESFYKSNPNFYETKWFEPALDALGAFDSNDPREMECSVRLIGKPSANVVVKLESACSNTNICNTLCNKAVTGSCSGSADLTFTPTNYNTAQSIKFESRDPGNRDIQQGIARFTVTASTTASNYPAEDKVANGLFYRIPHFLYMPYTKNANSNADYAIKLPAGKYKLYAWGALGGSPDAKMNQITQLSGFNFKFDCDNHGGIGGYVTGELKLSDSTTIYVYTGEHGLDDARAHNGGARSQSSYGIGGGGATDFCIGNSLCNSYDGHWPYRILVAGGGGCGFSASSCATGGPHSGGSADEYMHYTYGMHAGSEYSGSTPYAPGPQNVDGIFEGSTEEVKDLFGHGENATAAALAVNTTHRGAGGGGWYGGRAHCRKIGGNAYSRVGGGAGGNYIFDGVNHGQGNSDRKYALSNPKIHNHTIQNTSDGNRFQGSPYYYVDSSKRIQVKSNYMPATYNTKGDGFAMIEVIEP